jgi:UDP-N-acetylglucosamine pyrophosphorylase
VIRKRFASDKVGNIVEVDGRLFVIEYSDLPESVGKQTNPDGSLKIWAGSIAVHVFNVKLLERAQRDSSLPFHYARKKVPYIETKSGGHTPPGTPIKPEKENAIKFERFIFDLLPSAKDAVVVEVDPPNHYAPLKNAPGSASDSPEFLGYHVLSGSELTSQVIRKRLHNDKVGNIVEVDGRLYVIEYSDLPESVGNQTNPDGSLKIWAGSIAVHIFNVELLERAQRDSSLPFHYARKKGPFIETKSGGHTPPGTPIKPEKENAIKFERFIFDLLPSAKNAVVVEVDPPNHYAPLKNAPGSASDSPESVKRDISAMHTDWLRQAGAIVDEKEMLIEISALFADSPEAVAEKIKKGQRFEQPTFLV